MNLTCCPRECPGRYADERGTCHSTCKRYRDYCRQREDELQRKAKAMDALYFYHDVRQAVKRKHERKIRYENR